MVTRIATLRQLRRQRDHAQATLDAGLARHGLTLRGLRRLYAFDRELTGSGFDRGLNAKVASLAALVDRFGDEWAKDDWPHAIHARAPAVGAQIVGFTGIARNG